MSPTASEIKQQLTEATEHRQKAAEEEARILLALEQLECEEEERQIAEEQRIVEEKRIEEEQAEKEAKERRLEEMRVEAAKEAEEAQRAAEVAQKNRTTNVNMMEDSEWVL